MSVLTDQHWTLDVESVELDIAGALRLDRGQLAALAAHLLGR